MILTDIIPEGAGWLDSMSQNIGGDARRCICLFNSAGADVNGTYTIWVKAANTNCPWLRYGNPIVLADTKKGHAITGQEGLNCFAYIYVSKNVPGNADSWNLISSGNMGYP